MDSHRRFYTILLTVVAVYFGASLYIFNNVYDTIKVVVDEQFHIPQGQAYCEGNYSYWDPKITTLPGLYLISSIALKYFECDTYNLRFVNLVVSCFNLFLFGAILKFVYLSETKQVKIILHALNLALLPPLYFYSHVYYTDTLSLTMMLMYSRLSITSLFKLSILLYGSLSILMRQTNVAWVAMIFCHKTLDILLKSSRVFGNRYIGNIRLSKHSLIAQDIDKSKLKRYYGLSDVYYAMKYHISTCFVMFFKFLTFPDFLTLLTHTTLLTAFATFVYFNGSIVVGDKSAHEATLHLPQLLYFLIFFGVFALPYILAKLPSTIQLIFNNKLSVLLFGLMMAVVVHFNTVVHPYLLADNRHFTFYIWNRWFGKYDFAVYATIPVYIFLLFSLYDNIKDQNCICFLLPYTISVSILLGLQKMVEVRYFILPYLILRMRFARPPILLLILEFIYYVGINAAVFYVFFTKEVKWEEFDEAQRIMW